MDVDAVADAIELQIRAAVAAALASPDAAAAAAAPVAHVAVKLPEFWVSDPDMWFFQAECAFNRARITTSYTRFEHVVTRLPEHVVTSVRSLLLGLDAASPDAYELLKAQLIASFGKSRWQRGFALLDHPAIGDRRPSHMMAEMLALLPAGAQADTLFLCLFLRRLPAGMRDHLAAADYNTAAQMASHADLLWDARAGQPAASLMEMPAPVMPVLYGRSSSPHDSQRSSSPRESYRSSGRRRDRRDTPHSTGRLNPGLCRHHAKWGSKAYDCIPPCAWEEN